MKKLIIIVVPIAVVVAAALLVIIFAMPSSSEAPSGKLMSIESYVSQHISELSPQSAVLGGTFYVTDVAVAEGKGVVHYEDGHIALVADFTYEASDIEGIHITSFDIRE